MSNSVQHFNLWSRFSITFLLMLLIFASASAYSDLPAADWPENTARLASNDYIIGTWKVEAFSDSNESAWEKRFEASQVGKEITFSKSSIYYSAPFLDLGIPMRCYGKPSYKVKNINLPPNGNVIQKYYLNWYNFTDVRFMPFSKNNVLLYTAYCKSTHGRAIKIDFQLAKNGNIDYFSSMGFFTLKKIK